MAARSADVVLRPIPWMPPAFQGYLHKEGGRMFKNWKYRWFVLIDSTLSYRDDKKPLSPLNELSCRGARVTVLPPSRDRKFMFQLETAGRVLVMNAATEEDRELWVQHLSAAINTAQALGAASYPPILARLRVKKLKRKGGASFVTFTVYPYKIVVDTPRRQKTLPLLDSRIEIVSAADGVFVVTLACKNDVRDHTFEAPEHAAALLPLLRNASIMIPVAEQKAEEVRPPWATYIAQQLVLSVMGNPAEEMHSALLLEQGADPQAALLHAVECDVDADTVEQLVALGADVNRGPPYPLHMALEKRCSLEVVAVLLDAGANIHQRGTANLLPLHVATLAHNVAACRLLIAHGSDVNRGALDESTPPLYFAMQTADYLPTVQALLELGARASQPLRDAPWNELQRTVKSIRSSSAMSSQGAKPLLMTANERGDIELARVLLEYGA